MAKSESMKAKQKEKIKLVYPYIKDKVVLDIGCVGGNENGSQPPDEWFHGMIQEHVKDLYGIDNNTEGIDYLRSQGYDVSEDSAEDFELNKNFDVIVACNLIEHLDNPGLFLKSCSKHLKEGGKLLVTTPKTFNLLHLLRFFKNKEVVVDYGHTTWFNKPSIEKLLQNSNFMLEKCDTWSHIRVAENLFDSAYLKLEKFLYKIMDREYLDIQYFFVFSFREIQGDESFLICNYCKLRAATADEVWRHAKNEHFEIYQRLSNDFGRELTREDVLKYFFDN